MLPDERRRLEHLEHRLTSAPQAAGPGRSTDLETLADLYFQSDHYEPALETLEILLESPEVASHSRSGARTQPTTHKTEAGINSARPVHKGHGATESSMETRRLARSKNTEATRIMNPTPMAAFAK